MFEYSLHQNVEKQRVAEYSKQFSAQWQLMEDSLPIDMAIVFRLPRRHKTEESWASAMGDCLFADLAIDKPGSKGPLIRYDNALRILRRYARNQDPERWSNANKRYTAGCSLSEFPGPTIDT